MFSRYLYFCTSHRSTSCSVSFPEVGHEFDYLFIQFYNNYCYPGSSYFVSVMDTWLKWTNSINNGPLILLGLPSGVGAAGKSEYYFPPGQLAVAYKVPNKLTIFFVYFFLFLGMWLLLGIGNLSDVSIGSYEILFL